MTPSSAEEYLDGKILLFDKPLYWTSFDLVKKVKNLIRNRYGIRKIKVGHSGTLDPLATGLMIICTGKSTRKISELQGLDKEYIATLILGKTTPSFDLETEVDAEFPISHITKKTVLSAIENFYGEQQQVPPLFSAKNVGGRRAYEFARKGIEMELKTSSVIFHELDLLQFELPVVQIRMNCSKGTYIRSFARDFGKQVGSGAYLSELKRTRIGNFDIKDATTVEKFDSLLNSM